MYNHRSMLKNEIVIEFDNENTETNKEATLEVIKRLKEDNIGYSYWHSGNKSFHVHVLVDTGKAQNIRRLKKAFLDTYTEGLKIKPDYQLCIDHHLIRAENGLHEASGKHKTLIRCTENYPTISTVPPRVWSNYERATLQYLRFKPKHSTKLRDIPQIKYLLRTQDFGSVGDGRERALFILSQVLKEEYQKQEDLIKFLQDWYKYSGGKKLSQEEVAKKVKYQLRKNYNITERYINEFLEEIGAKDNAKQPSQNILCSN
jgi:hypothetical protein